MFVTTTVWLNYYKTIHQEIPKKENIYILIVIIIKINEFRSKRPKNSL